MPTPSTANLPTPKDWDEFENLCADLFSKEWGDRNATRNGRQGQRQHGVDIYGSPTTGGLAGVQCKGKRTWPPRPLTIAEIDKEVAEAKKFEPALSEFTIATAAAVDGPLQEHVRKITERHKQERLFTVHIAGWDELTRRLAQDDRLVEKHFSFVGLSSVRDAITKVSDQTENLSSQLQELSLAGRTSPGTVDTSSIESARALGAGLADAWERDLGQRYRRALQRQLFPEVRRTNELAPMANEILEGARSGVSENLRRRVLLRAARTAAVYGNLSEAECFLTAGQAVPGEEPIVVAEARLLHARGLPEEAIAKVRDETTPDARSALLSILAQVRGEEAALAWLADGGLTAGDLTPGGIQVLANIYLKKDIASARDFLIAVPDSVLADSPYLIFFRAALRLASLFAKPDRGLALLGFPIDVRTAHPVVAQAIVEEELDSALADLHRVQPLLAELELAQALKLAECLKTWCEVLHPQRRQRAIQRLRAQMAKPDQGLSNLQFALAYDTDFDPTTVRVYLDKRERHVGWNDDDLRAALVLRIHCDDAHELAALVSKYRGRLEGFLGKEAVVSLEVQALARVKDATSAKLVLEENRAAISHDMARVLEAEVARAEGADPVVALRNAYEQTQNTDALRNLVAELLRRKDHKALAHFAEKLFDATGDPDDLILAANALARARDDNGFLRIVAAHPELVQSNTGIARHYAWKLFELGRMLEALALAQRLRTEEGGKYRDFQLEIAIAVETGAWETLATPLNDLLASANDRSAISLIRAAHLAQVSQQGSLVGLLTAAIAKGPDDPHVLIAAYTIVLEEGLEEKKPEANEWFRKALDLSGVEGPVKSFELRELLSQQSAWNERTGKINEAIVEGKLPLIIAAQGFRTTLVDLLLRNLVGGSKQADARKRSALPLFSGRRKPMKLGDVKAIALDASATIVLAWLGVLPRVLQSYPKVYVPASTLTELFDGYSRIRKFQRSQITRAREVLGAIGKKSLKVHHSPAAIRDPLAREVGAGFVSLLRGADAVGGLIVHPAPLRRLGFEHDQDADVSDYSHRLVDLHCVLDALADEGMIDEATEDTARRYLTVQDKRWPNRPVLKKATPLFLDDLALHYLQAVGLLDPVLRYFDSVSVDKSTEDQALVLSQSAGDSADILTIIDELRTAVHNAWSAGKVKFGPKREHSAGDAEQDDADENASEVSTINLLADLMQADVVIVDDRALNKEAFASDSKGQRAHTATSLDILEDLKVRGLLSDAERRNLRHRLRSAGAVLVPVSEEEIVAAALRSKSKESAELRAIRESISLARMAKVPRFPSEMPWLANVALAIKGAILGIWIQESDKARAARLARAVLNLRLRLAEWLEEWGETPPPEWVEEVEAVITATLAVPVELEDDAVVEAYQAWLEEELLAPLRDLNSAAYQRVVTKVRDFLLNQPGEEDESA